MNPARFLARVFIDVFGITHPTPQQENQATWFIMALLVLTLILFVATGVFFLGHAR